MEKSERPIIVPWDFSHVAENAFRHAVNFSKILNRKVLLLHIVPEEKDEAGKEKELIESAAKLEAEHGVHPGHLVRSGSIFKTIGETAKEQKAEMIIMGTHGMKGAQKLFGSKALRVVVSSRIPFLVIQDAPKKDQIDSILLPIDFKSENKEKANWIYYLAHNFEARFTIFKSRVKDKGFKRKIISNIKYIETYLRSQDVDYEIVTAPGKKKFKKEVVEYAFGNDFDMVLIMTTRDINWVDYFFGAPEQYIIANKHNLPVMCINPRPMRITGGFRATGSA